MNKEKILEIARRYTAPETESRILFDKDGNATGETVTMAYWNFCEEELIAFAKSVIEADRESSERPAFWLLPGDVLVEYNPETYGIEGTAIGLLYRRPAPARKPLSEEEIDEIYREFPSRIYLFARRIEKAHGIGETE